MYLPLWASIGLGLYLLPSILPAKHSNRFVKILLFLLRLPGIGIRVVFIGGWFFVTLALGLILTQFVKNKYDISKIVGRMNHWMCCALFGVVPVFTDLRYLQEFERGVMIFNHQSFFDGVYLNALWAFLPGPVVGVAKKGLESWPLVGWYWKSVGGLFVENSHSHGDEETKRNIEMVDAVTKRIQNENLTVFLSPEGHRNSKPTILDFKKGAFHMAVNACVPIVPVVIETFYDKIMECRFPWSPNTIQMRVLEPISTKGISGKDEINKLAIDTRLKMLNCLNELNKDHDVSVETSKSTIETKKSK
jgi:lysophosphatidate acyltransferase